MNIQYIKLGLLATLFVDVYKRQRYGTGSNGILNATPDHSWGPKLTTENYYGYNPRDDYFQTEMCIRDRVYSPQSKGREICIESFLYRVSYQTRTGTIIC